jgi:hypothetical protein
VVIRHTLLSSPVIFRHMAGEKVSSIEPGCLSNLEFSSCVIDDGKYSTT